MFAETKDKHPGIPKQWDVQTEFRLPRERQTVAPHHGARVIEATDGATCVLFRRFSKTLY